MGPCRGVEEDKWIGFTKSKDKFRTCARHLIMAQMCSAPKNTHILMAQTPLKQEFYYIPKDNLFPVAKTTLQSAKPLKGLKSSSFILPHFSFVLHHPSSFFIHLTSFLISRLLSFPACLNVMKEITVTDSYLSMNKEGGKGMSKGII